MKIVKVIGRKVFENDIQVAEIKGNRDPKNRNCSGFWIEYTNGIVVGKMAACKGSFAYMADAASYAKENN